MQKLKSSHYFSHDSNARTDEKILPIRAKYGAKGYGIYFMILEMLREAKDYQLLNNWKAIAYELHEDEKDVEDIIKNYGLFKFNENFFYSVSLKSRMKYFDSIIEKRRMAGKKGGEANAKHLVKQNEAYIKKSKVKKSNINNISKDILAPPEKSYGNDEINKMITALKEKIGIDFFVDSRIERNIGKHCVSLLGKIGKDEFVRRLDVLLKDTFHYKNCNKILYVYNNLKGFIEPKVEESGGVGYVS